MSSNYFKKFPKTSYTMPNNQVFEVVDIFRTAKFTETFKKDLSAFKNYQYIESDSLDKLAYNEYLDHSAFFVIGLFNEMISHKDFPLSYDEEQNSLERDFRGTAYYFDDVLDKIKSGDVVVFYTALSSDKWKEAGVVKYYDKKFRRIVVKEEFTNTSNEDNLKTSPLLYVYRKNLTTNTYDLVYGTGDSKVRYKKQIEKDMLMKFITLTDGGRIEISPYRKLDSAGSVTEQFDFSNNLNTETALYKFIHNETTPPTTSLRFEREKINNSKRILKIPNKKFIPKIKQAYFNMIRGTSRRGSRVIA
tara:strand:- start:207 stop:1118 length:912 start_codon:yes stop_codon:yes gene_type:complete